MSGISFSMGAKGRAKAAPFKMQTNTKLNKAPEVFGAGSDDDDDSSELQDQKRQKMGQSEAPTQKQLSGQLDDETKATAEKLAEFVAKNGKKFEDITRQRNPSDGMFKFLFDTNSAGYRYYSQKVQELSGIVEPPPPAPPQSYRDASAPIAHMMPSHPQPPLPQAFPTQPPAPYQGAHQPYPPPTQSYAQPPAPYTGPSSSYAQPPAAYPGPSQAPAAPSQNPWSPAAPPAPAYGQSHQPGAPVYSGQYGSYSQPLPPQGPPPGAPPSTGYSGPPGGQGYQSYGQAGQPAVNHPALQASYRAPPQPSANLQAQSSGPAHQTERKRRSRWGEGPSEPAHASAASPMPRATPPLTSATTGPILAAKPSQPSQKQPGSSVGGLAKEKASSTDDSLAAMEKFAAQAAAREQEKADKEAVVPLLNETSFDRRRVMAVYKEDGTRGHHMSDFIPKEELAKLLAKSGTAEGKAQAEAIEAASRIQSDNIGHKLLSQMGWKEGEGLGASGAGVAAPVAASSDFGGDKRGLGAEDHTAVQEGDDEFEIYRKRMMLGYKHRPNPLGNPRKNYY